MPACKNPLHGQKVQINFQINLVKLTLNQQNYSQQTSTCISTYKKILLTDCKGLDQELLIIIFT